MIELLTLLSICVLSSGNRLLLQTTLLPPPGYEYGAFGQFCATLEPGAAICETTSDTAYDLLQVNCEKAYDCCLCSSITCGTQAYPCQSVVVGQNGAFGVKSIDITGSNTVIECMGDNSCANTVIRAKQISEIACTGKYSCANAVIIIEEPQVGFELICGVTGACTGLQIALNFAAPPAGFACSPTNIADISLGSIECVGVSACRNLFFLINNEGCGRVVLDSVECRSGSCDQARFDFIGNVEIQSCILPSTGVLPYGLATCFTGLAGLICPDAGSCQNQVRHVTNPANNFELSCVGESSCADSTFIIDVTAAPRTAPEVLVNIDCAELNACENTRFGINESGKQVKVNVQCMATGACDNAVFVSVGGIGGVGTTFTVLCEEPDFCVGCRYNGVSCAQVLPV